MPNLMRCLKTWLSRKPLSIDPIWLDLDRRERKARLNHAAVRHLQKAKTDRVHELLRRGIGVR